MNTRENYSERELVPSDREYRIESERVLSWPENSDGYEIVVQVVPPSESDSNFQESAKNNLEGNLSRN